jgi:type I restriction enzyme R subunit
MPHAYTEDQLCEQPAITLFAELGWQTVSAMEEVFGAPSPGLSATLSHPMGEGASLGRETPSEVVLIPRLRSALEKLNPTLAPDAITAAIDELTRDRSAMLLEQANREVYRLLKEGIPVSVADNEESTPHPGPLPGRGGEGGISTLRPGSQSSAPRPSPGLRPPSPAPASEGYGRGGEGKGGQTTVRVRVMDWEQPANNDFLLVSQFSVTGALYTCRPDLVGFVNGLPLVVI